MTGHMRIAMHLMDRNELCSILSVYPIEVSIWPCAYYNVMGRNDWPYENSYAIDGS